MRSSAHRSSSTVMTEKLSCALPRAGLSRRSASSLPSLWAMVMTSGSAKATLSMQFALSLLNAAALANNTSLTLAGAAVMLLDRDAAERRDREARHRQVDEHDRTKEGNQDRRHVAAGEAAAHGASPGAAKLASPVSVSACSSNETTEKEKSCPAVPGGAAADAEARGDGRSALGWQEPRRSCCG